MILLMRGQITGPVNCFIGSEFSYIDVGARTLCKLCERRDLLTAVRKKDKKVDALHFRDATTKWFDFAEPPTELLGADRWVWDPTKLIIQRFDEELLLENLAYNETVVHRDGVRWVAQQVDGEHIYESPRIPWSAFKVLEKS